MGTMTVWKFESATGAEFALALLERLQREELLQINDAAYVFWPEGKKQPKTQQLHSMTGMVRWAGASGACCSG